MDFVEITKNIPCIKDHSFEFKEVSDEEVLTILRRIGNPSAGTDGITAQVIKSVAEESSKTGRQWLSSGTVGDRERSPCRSFL